MDVTREHNKSQHKMELNDLSIDISCEEFAHMQMLQLGKQQIAP